MVQGELNFEIIHVNHKNGKSGNFHYFTENDNLIVDNTSCRGVKEVGEWYGGQAGEWYSFLARRAKGIELYPAKLATNFEN